MIMIFLVIGTAASFEDPLLRVGATINLTLACGLGDHPKEGLRLLP